MVLHDEINNTIHVIEMIMFSFFTCQIFRINDSINSTAKLTLFAEINIKIFIKKIVLFRCGFTINFHDFLTAQQAETKLFAILEILCFKENNRIQGLKFSKSIYGLDYL